MDRRKLIKAVAAAFGAQGITAAVSALTVFLLAGDLDAAGYGLWQIYSLAGSYSGLFHLGLCDGVYLRLGGLKYCELDFYRLGRQFRRMLFFQTLFALSAAFFIILIFGFSGRPAVLCLALVYMPFFNAAAYLGYILQATGRTPEYSMSTVTDRAAFAVFAAAAAMSGTGNFTAYIAASIAAKLISLVYCVIKNREIVFAPMRRMPAEAGRKLFSNETIADIAAGSKLLWANLSGQFVGGAARVAIILGFGDAEFGRISFVMTLSVLFLQFAAQFGMVIFPSMRRENDETRRRIVERMRSAAGIALPALFLLYLPVKLAVEAFLPQYALRINYLAFILPFCLFEVKTQLINQTYLKVSRMEKRLLKANLLSAGLSALLCFFSAFVLRSVTAVLISAVLSSAAHCYMSDFRSADEGGRRDAFTALLDDASASVVFIAASLLLPDIAAFFAYALFYSAYLFIRRGELRRLLPIKI
jgi:O-antigen/teichoic acid export membrane protein